MSVLDNLNGWHWVLIGVGLWGLVFVAILLLFAGGDDHDEGLYDHDLDYLDAELADLLEQEDRP